MTAVMSFFDSVLLVLPDMIKEKSKRDVVNHCGSFDYQGRSELMMTLALEVSSPDGTTGSRPKRLQVPNQVSNRNLELFI